MSITAETAKQHANDPAVLCCRAEEGTVLAPSNFEDPAIFPDLIDSGLLNTDGALKLGQVLNGSKLTKTVDSLTPITPDIIDKYDELEGEEEAPAEEAAPVEEAPVAAPAATLAPVVGGTIKLHIGEGKNIDIELPAGLGGGAVAAAPAAVAAAPVAAEAAAPVEEEKVVRTLSRRHLRIDKVERGPETKIENHVLYIEEGIEEKAVESEKLVQSLKIDVITPENYHTYSETIMDIQPIATKEGEAEKGDTVNIDYEGFKDGVAFDGGKAENYNLELGSGSFIPGFEDQLIGVKAGDEKELNLTFPEDYHADELKGAAVVFKVKVNEVKTKVLPEIDDDFAADVNIPNVSTAEELKKTVRERLENNKKNAAEQKADNELMDALVAKVEVDLPDVMVDEEVQNQVNQLAAQIQQYGMSLTQYLSMMGKKPEDLKKDYHDQAEKTVRLRLGLAAVAKAEGLEVTEEDLENQYKEIAEQYSMDVEKVRNLINPEMLKKDVLNQKAYDFIKENAETGENK